MNGRRTLGSSLWALRQALQRRWFSLTDSKRIAESRSERVVYRYLERSGFLECFRGGRILEIGPKHGEDSRLLATLGPSELVLLDLPEKDELVRPWLPEVESLCSTRYVRSNLLYLTPDELQGLGTFDLVWCLGVIYHNVEQVRLLRRLFNLTRAEGALVLESSTTRNRRLAKANVVEIHWPDLYRGERTITHHPSRRALASWLEMVGFDEVRIEPVYSRKLAWQRAVLTARRPRDPRPYVSYDAEGAPAWIAGEAT